VWFPVSLRCRQVSNTLHRKLVVIDDDDADDDEALQQTTRALEFMVLYFTIHGRPAALNYMVQNKRELLW